MQYKLLPIGYGNMVSMDRLIALLSPDSTKIKRLINQHKDNGTVLDATSGRKTRSVIIMDNDTIVLSALNPETLFSRINSDITKNMEDTKEVK